jgi:hypothetical protein
VAIAEHRRVGLTIRNKILSRMFLVLVFKYSRSGIPRDFWSIQALFIAIGKIFG